MGKNNTCNLKEDKLLAEEVRKTSGTKNALDRKMPGKQLKLL